jgi:hypothetical protein
VARASPPGSSSDSSTALGREIRQRPPSCDGVQTAAPPLHGSICPRCPASVSMWIVTVAELSLHFLTSSLPAGKGRRARGGQRLESKPPPDGIPGGCLSSWRTTRPSSLLSAQPRPCPCPRPRARSLTGPQGQPHLETPSRSQSGSAAPVQSQHELWNRSAPPEYQCGDQLKSPLKPHPTKPPDLSAYRLGGINPCAEISRQKLAERRNSASFCTAQF